MKIFSKKKRPLRRVSGGKHWADAIYSFSATTDRYILYKCRILQDELAKDNIVVQTKLLRFKRFRIFASGKAAFAGDFAFVERCRATSATAFIETMRQHIRAALGEYAPGSEERGSQLTKPD